MYDFFSPTATTASTIGITHICTASNSDPVHVLKDYIIVILSNCDRDIYIR
jgi:hypothetical protein